MSSLDQAFIKAYQHPGDDPGELNPVLPKAKSAPRESDRAATMADAPLESLAVGIGRELPLASRRSKKIAEKPCHTVPLAVALHYDTQLTDETLVASATSATREEVLEAFGRPPARSMGGLDCASIGAAQPQEGCSLAQATSGALDTPITEVSGPPELAAQVSSGSPAAPPAATEQCPPPTVTPAEPLSTIPSLLAGYQVDHFIWPEVCDRLAAAADGPLEQLAEGLAGVPTGLGRVVAMIGCRRGEGTTTLCLAAARKRARSHCRTILVDVDLEDAQLGRRLGIQAETGLEDVLSGRMTLADVIVESVEDGLALLPLRGPLAATESALKYLAQDLQSLRVHYDLILLKLGPLGDGEIQSGSLVVRSLASQVDTAVVVHNLRSTSEQSLDDLCVRLEDSGVAQVVVAENFAPE